MAGWRAEVLHAGNDRLGEGPLWCPESRRLWWLDIFDAELHSFDPATGAVDTQRLAHKVHALARARWPWFVGTAHRLGVSWIDLESGAFQPIGHPEAGLATHLLNDACCDEAGQLWFASIHKQHEPTAALYRLDAGGRIERMHAGLKTGNGMAFSPDGRWLYLIDTYVGILRFPRRDDGGVGEPTLLLESKLLQGWPDGMTIDSDGCLWVALAHGGAVLRLTPDGKVDATLGIPARFPTSCTFGGPGLDTLYVTSATIGRAPEELAAYPLSGALFAIRTGHHGVPDTPYAGQRL